MHGVRKGTKPAVKNMLKVDNSSRDVYRTFTDIHMGSLP